MAQYDDLNTRQIWIVGLLSVVLTGISILAVHVLYYALLTRHEQLVSERSEYAQGNRYIARQLTQISSYGRDGETGEIRIPVETAFELMLENQSPIAPAAKAAIPPAEAPAGNSPAGNPPPAQSVPAEPVAAGAADAAAAATGAAAGEATGAAATSAEESAENENDEA